VPNFANNNPDYWAKLADPKNLPAVAAADSWMDAIKRHAATNKGSGGGGAASTQPKITRSPDGLVSYDQYGRRLDSLGHVAYGGGSNASTYPGALPGAAPAYNYPVSAITGQPLPLAPSLPMEIPFVDPSFATPGIAGPGQAPVAWPELSDAMMQRALAYYNAALPWVQTNINAYQSQRDFGEARRRFDLEFPQRQAEAGYAAAGRAQLPAARYVSYR
jgi:hypothetical protein